MTTDFRSLCAELVGAIESESKTTILGHTLMCAYIKATDALEQPGAVGDRVAELEAELERERLRLAACGVVAMADTPETAAKARDMHPDCRSASLDDVIRQVDALMALRSKLAQPEPSEPSAWMYRDEPYYDGRNWHDQWQVTLDEKVARYKSGNKEPIPLWPRPAITPISVSERLPGVEDCDAEGKCWLLGKIESDWRLISVSNSGVPKLSYCFSHWLPHHALPVPQSE